MHHIDAIDLALGTIQRHNEEIPSWHRLETPVADLSTENCALRDMNVEASPVTVEFNGKKHKTTFNVPTIAHPINNGELLFLGKPYDRTYRLFTPREFVDFAAQCFREAGLDNKIAFTTTLFSGARMTIAKHIPDSDFKDAKGHEIRTYANLLNSLDGSWPTFVNASETRTVCFNTATMNIMEGGASCKHRKDALDAFIKDFPRIFGEAVTLHKGSANDYLRMADIRVTKEDAKNFFAALLTRESKLSTLTLNTVEKELLPLFVKGRGCYGETGADLYNATTEHYTHEFSQEANAPDGTADKRKRAAKEAILSEGFGAMLERGKKLVLEKV